MQSFLTAASKSSPLVLTECVNITTSLGRPVSQSCIVNGLLIECPQSSSNSSSNSRGTTEGTTEEVLLVNDDSRGIITALFDVSFAGDFPDG